VNTTATYTGLLADGNSSNTIPGFDQNRFIIDLSPFTADPAVSGGVWLIGTNSLAGGGESLSLTYAVPEPSTYALFALAALTLAIAVKRRVSS